MQRLALGERVANLEDAVVGQADNVPGPCLVDGLLALRHELRGAAEAHGLAQALVLVGRVAHKLARAHLAEGDATAVVGVDVGGYLEDEARELGLVGPHHALLGLRGTGTGGYLHKAVKQFLHAEVVQGRAEEHRRDLALEVLLHAERGIYPLHQFQVLAQLGRVALAHPLVQVCAVDVNLHLLCHLLLVGGEQVEALLIYVIDPLEAHALADGPRQGSHANLEFLFQLVQEVEGVTPLAVHLIDEDDDRRPAHAAHAHQFAGLGFHSLGAVHHDDGAVHGGERAEGVLRKVLVPRRVQDVDLVALVLELHHAGCDRYSALLLYLHPVAGRRLAYLVALHCPGHLYLPPEEQELLGERGLARIGVRYDGKGSPSLYFLVHL